MDCNAESREALNHEVPIVIKKKSRAELDREYGKIIVSDSVCVWAALTMAVERDSSISDIVMNAKSPSQAWIILTSMVEDTQADFYGLKKMSRGKMIFFTFFIHS